MWSRSSKSSLSFSTICFIWKLILWICEWEKYNWQPNMGALKSPWFSCLPSLLSCPPFRQAIFANHASKNCASSEAPPFWQWQLHAFPASYSNFYSHHFQKISDGLPFLLCWDSLWVSQYLLWCHPTAVCNIHIKSILDTTTMCCISTLNFLSQLSIDSFSSWVVCKALSCSSHGQTRSRNLFRDSKFSLSLHHKCSPDFFASKCSK